MKTLKEKLMLRKKDALMDYAKALGIRRISALKKEALADKICETILDPNQLFYRMAILDDYEMQLFNAAIIAPVLINDTNESGLIKLCAMDLAIAYIDRHVRVPDDVAQAFKKVDIAKLTPYREKASWIYKCLRWCEDMYGCYPADVFVDVINSKQGLHVTAEEAINIFDHLPPTEVWSYLCENVFIFSDYVSEVNELRKLTSIQADKDYYIPSSLEVEEYCDTEALISDKAYQNLNLFLVNEIGYGKEDARDLLLDMWFKNAFEDDLRGTLEWFMGEIVFDGGEQARKAVDLFMKAYNNTRMLLNRGHKPGEILSRRPIGPGNMPTIVAGSSKAADMLSKVAPDIRNMGFGLDLESNADTMTITQPGNDKTVIQKKIYPNDPCPCGSGKKYKKCCGRNK